MIVDLTFCEAHWIFAWYYYKVSNNMPIVIEQAIIPAGRNDKYDFVYNVGIVLNALFPVCEGAFSSWLLL